MNDPFRPQGRPLDRPELVGGDEASELPDPGVEDERLGAFGVHVAVPAFQQVAGAPRQRARLPAEVDAAKAREERAGEERYPILLERTEALGVVPGPGREPLQDPLRPESRRPLEGEAVRVVHPGDVVIGGDEGLARRVVCSGKGVEGNEAGPVVATVPPRPRRRPGPGFARLGSAPHRDPS